MTFLIFISVFLCIFFAGYGLFKKDKNVSIYDEKTQGVAVVAENKGKITLTGAVLSFIVVYIITGNIYIAIAVSFFGGYLFTNWWIERQIKKRKDLLSEQFQQVLNAVITNLRGGLSPYQSLEELLTQIDNPARKIIKEIIRRSRQGMAYEDAMHEVKEESSWEELLYLETAYRVNATTGGHLGSILSFIYDSNHEAKGNKKYVESVTAQGITSAKILSGIPVFVVVAMRFIAPDFAYPLFHTVGGYTVLAISAGMIIIGNLIVRKMIDAAV